MGQKTVLEHGLVDQVVFDWRRVSFARLYGTGFYAEYGSCTIGIGGIGQVEVDISINRPSMLF